MKLSNCLLSLVAAAVVASAVPVFNDSVAPTIDKLVYYPEEHVEVVPGEYLVTVHPETDLEEHTVKMTNLLDSTGQGNLLNTFAMNKFKCYHIRTYDNQVLQSIAAMEQVKRLEPNLVATGTICSSHDTMNWGLTRINFQAIPDYSTEQKYHYDTTGNGATIYLLDSGIKKSLHHLIGSKVYYGMDFIDTRGPQEQLDTDEHGHGTGIAGFLVSQCCGMAKQAVVVDVRILNENNRGDTAVTLSGLQYVLNAQTGTPPPGRPWPSQPAVINLSIQMATLSSTMDDALRQLFNAGITTVTASGNRKANACAYSPSGHRTVIAVGATDKNDRFWFPSSGTKGSNYGKCVTILAPGVDVRVPSRQLLLYQIATGTSISAAFVTGTLARLISSGTTPTPAMLRYTLLQSASIRASISNLQRRTTNRLLHMECV